MKPVCILVVTPSKGFGQLILQTLEESSHYTVTLVYSLNDAIISINRNYFDLSILDATVKESSSIDLVKRLHIVRPQLKLIIIPPENDLSNPLITAIAPDGYLTKPFYLPDLFDTIDEVLGLDQIPLVSHAGLSGEKCSKEADESREIIPQTSENRQLGGEKSASDANFQDVSKVSSINNVMERFIQQNQLPNTPKHTNSSDGTASKTRTQTRNTTNNQRSIGSLQIEGLRPLSPSMHNLSFAYLLHPLVSAHHMIGELASSMAQWFYQLFIACGWQKEHHSMHPGYLFWMALVSTSTSLSVHIRIPRKQISQRMFSSFPQLKKNNPSGDYWAPGYLIVSSNQLPTESIINQHIHLTHQHQGV